MPDTEQRQAFFDALFACCTEDTDACLTLTAIHPDGKHNTPSRHIPVHDTVALRAALTDIDQANALGWGAYFAVGLRRPGLTRWQRGGAADVIALPALFVDVDDPSPEALKRLRCAHPTSSCIVASGGGFHAYWWLDEPTADLPAARHLLRGLASALHGDPLSVAQSLRVPQSHNTKPMRDHALCRVLELHDHRYPLEAFQTYRSQECTPHCRSLSASTTISLNSDTIRRVADALLASGSKPRGDWLNGACPFPTRHKHEDRHPSFGFNTKTGYGFCHVCGTLPLKDLCSALGISSVT